MSPALFIDRATGCVRIGSSVVLQAHQTKADVETQARNLVAGSQDHGNGYEWIRLRGLTFGGQPATLMLYFHNDMLKQIAWSVQLHGAPMEGGWPTQEAIDNELTFVRETLDRDMSIREGSTPWGEIWSHFDAKGFMAANGLSYR
jgi:hypothetical protein